MPAIRHDDLLLRLVKDVNDIKAMLRRTVANFPLYDIANENTPAQITVSQNNYSPGNYDNLRLTSSQAVNITGMTGGVKGRSLLLFNDGSYPITLVHQSVLSTAANRFRFSSSFDAVILPQANLSLYYDSINSRWIDADRNAAGPVFVSLSRVASLAVPSGAYTKVIGFTANNDSYSFYDVVNSKVVIKFRGVYLITLLCYWGTETTGEAQEMYIYVNGAAAYSYTQVDSYLTGTVPGTEQITVMAYLDEGDEVEFYVRNNGATNNNAYDFLATLGRF